MRSRYTVRRSHLGIREKYGFDDITAAHAKYDQLAAELPDAFVELSEWIDGVIDVIKFQSGEIRFER